jgi:phosphoribosyl 1,2-cyclic phosphodiesterase
VYVESGDGDGVILDAGTGLRALGAHLRPMLTGRGRPISTTMLLTHLHYDHLLGLPFFSPLEDPGAMVAVYGPSQGDATLSQVINAAVTPPFFPVQMKEFRGEVSLHDLGDADFEVSGLSVTSRWVPHTGPTLGFRIESAAGSIAYLPDHQAPLDRTTVPDSVLELCRDADVVIHDAQYTDEEFAAKADWGHSTVAYAVHVAAEADARELVLFHHDPSHDDDQLIEMEAAAAALPEAQKLTRIVAAREGMMVEL